MKAEDFRYTWVLPKSAWYVKLYLWVWEASVDDVTFCKLFWGYALIWVGLPLHLLASVLRLPGKARRKVRAARTIDLLDPEPRSESKSPNYEILQSTLRAVKGRKVTLKLSGYRPGVWWVGEKVIDDSSHSVSHVFNDAGTYLVEAMVAGRKIGYFVEVHERPLPPTRILEGVGDGFSRLSMFVDAHKQVYNAVFLVVGVVAAMAMVAVAGYGIERAVVTYDSWYPNLHELGLAGLCVGGGLGATALTYGVLFLFLRTSLVRFLGEYLARPVGRGAKRGALGFRDAMRIGYVAVKSNTCPRVVIEENDE